jgi:NarL family two-component system response regulator LiaR
MSRIRTLIADDHAVVREGIVAMLSFHDDIEVVGEASDGLEAVRLADELQPDVIIMDISMPGLGGLEATQEIKKKHKDDIKVLVLSQYDDSEYVARFLEAGVAGYILKKAVGNDLVSALRAVAAGGSYLYPSIAARVVDGYLSKKTANVADPLQKITTREQQVLKLIAEGLTNKDIADALNISVKTVVAHQTNLSDKLDIHTRAGLIKFAFQKRIVT